MAIAWTTKRQLLYFVIFLLAVLSLVSFFWLRTYQPTCFDNKQNQNEEGIDCNGPCQKKCLGEVRNLIVLWSKFFEISKNKYDVVALVKNPNAFLALSSVKYQFKFYDKNNILIAVKEGETFITPAETFPIFETNIETGSRIPSRVFIEFEENLKWARLEKEKLSLVVSQKEFFNEPPFPRLVINLENKSIASVDDIFLAAVLYDEDKNAQGASVTKIDSISSQSSQKVVFTWPQLFSEEPSSIEIFFRRGLEH